MNNSVPAPKHRILEYIDIGPPVQARDQKVTGEIYLPPDNSDGLSRTSVKKDVRLSALVLTQGIYHVELRFACVSTAVFNTTFVDYPFAI